MLSARHAIRLRASIPLLVLFVSAAAGCAAAPDTDLVIYKAPIIRIDDRPYSRSLVVLGGLRALGLMKSSSGDLEVREGAVMPETWDAIRVDISATKHLRSEPTPGDGLLSYQIFAQLGPVEIALHRRVDEQVAKALASARERLEKLWDGLPVAEDPVEALERWVESPIARARGRATEGLLIAMNSPSVSSRGQERADLIIHGRLQSETNPALLRMIEDSLKDVSER